MGFAIVCDPKDKQVNGAADAGVPKAVVSRLSLYLRELQRLVREGSETTSSTQLGKTLGFTDAQVRKDLANFGQFGYPGIGYRCGELIEEIKKILGTNHLWPVALVGLGNLGRALLRYRGFRTQGFQITAAFETDDELVGDTVEGIEVFHLDRVSEVVSDRDIRLGIIAVPAENAQQVASKLAAAGVDGILNFAPVTLTLPGGVSKIGVDLAIELEQLSFAVVNRPQNP